MALSFQNMITSKQQWMQLVYVSAGGLVRTRVSEYRTVKLGTGSPFPCRKLGNYVPVLVETDVIETTLAAPLKDPGQLRGYVVTFPE
jgi:hypothetical protein